MFNMAFFLLFLKKKPLKSLSNLFFLLFTLLFFSCTTKKESGIDPLLFEARIKRLDRVNDKLRFLDSIRLLSIDRKNDSGYRKLLFDLSAEYYYINDYKQSLALSKKLIDLSKEANDSLSIAKSYYYVADAYQLAQNDSSYFYYFKAEQLYIKLGVTEMIGKMLFKKGYLLFYEGNYLESEIQVSKALILLKKSKDIPLLISCYTLMGVNFEKLEEYDEAITYYKLIKELLRKTKEKEFKEDRLDNYNVTTAINLANVYEKNGEYDKSIAELTAVIDADLKKKWPSDYAAVIGNIGHAKMKKGDLKGVEKLLLESLDLSKSCDNEINLLYKFLNLGEYYICVHDTVRAKNYLNTSLKLAKKTKSIDEVLISLRLLAKIDPVKDTYYNDDYISIKDSLIKKQRKSQGKYARIEYETSVIEDENKVLSAKNTYILIGSLLLIFALVLVIVYRYIKSQKREIAFRKAQQKAEEEIFELLKEYQVKLNEAKKLEQHRISKELHDSVMNKLYGARMQLGILNGSDEMEVKEKRLFYVDLLQDVEQEIRTISHDLHVEALDAQFDYSSLLTNLIQLQNEIGVTVFTIKSDASIDWDTVDGLLKITIYRIVQEGILNVTKYAAAKQCSISISKNENGGLVLILEDDGIGFDVTTKSTGIGLKNMKERASLLKSELEVTSALGVGTTIKVVFNVA